jgi:hypothetical protein
MTDWRLLPRDYCIFCTNTGWSESDYAPGTFYPCSTCNPKGTCKPLPSRA